MSSTNASAVSESFKKSLTVILTALIFTLSSVTPNPSQADDGSDDTQRFSTFSVHKAEVKVGNQSDRFKVEGWGVLGQHSNGVDLFNEDIIVTLGDYTETIPGSAFFQTDEAFKYESNTRNGIQKIKFRFDGRFRVKGRGINLGEVGSDVAVVFTLGIGNDIGSTELIFDSRGRYRGQGRRSDGMHRFSSFRINETEIESHRRDFEDEFRIKGFGLLGPDNDGVNFLSESITITLGNYTETIPGSAFFQTDESYKFENDSRDGIHEIEFKFDGRFEVKARRINLNVDGSTMFSMHIGNDVGDTVLKLSGDGLLAGQIDDEDEIENEDEDGGDDN